MTTSTHSSSKRYLFLQPNAPLKPEVTYGENGMMNGISCEDRFYDFEAITEGVFDSEEPLLTDITISYEYEANIARGVDVGDVIRDVERTIFLDVAASTPLYSADDSGGELTAMNCDKLIALALDLPFARMRLRGRQLNESDDWKNFLGIKSTPEDEKSGKTCQTSMTADPDTTCYSINAFATVQVPEVQELDPDFVRMKVLQHVKSSMDSNSYATNEMPRMSFVGMRSIDGDGIDINRDEVLNVEPPTSEPTDDGLLTPLGISLAAGLSIAVLLAGLICGVRMKKQRKLSDGQFAKLDDPVVLGGDGDGDHESDMSPRPSKRNVFTQASPESVEVIDVNENKGAGGWTNCGQGSCGGQLSIGDFMDNFRATDESVSLESEDYKSIAEDSALSVQTEEYGK